LVTQGINPFEYRKQQRRAVRSAAEHAFEVVFVGAGAILTQVADFD